MLTKHQNLICNQIISKIIDEKEKHIILKGCAGVGKTYMVNGLIEQYRNMLGFQYKRVYLCAPTNKAVAVLEEKARQYFGSIPSWMTLKTIHSALFLKRQINEKTGEIFFKPDYNPAKEKPFDAASLVIVDESSMLNTEILTRLEDEKFKHIPFIFVGDYRQLNPVNEPDSPIFKRIEEYMSQQSYGIHEPFIEVNIDGVNKQHFFPLYQEFELTEIIRQGEGNPIISLSRDIDKVKFRETNLTPNGQGYEYTRDKEYIIDILMNNPRENRFLAWTNKEVNAMNSLLRIKLYGMPNKIEQDEYIVFGEPYEDLNGTLHSTNSELEIKTVEIKEQKFTIVSDKKGISWEMKIDLSYYLINGSIRIVHESSELFFYNAIKRIKEAIKREECTWRTYFEFTEQFAKFHYQYALTVHKSQGSTYNTVIINQLDLNFNRNLPEKTRLWYTAITRASNKAIMYEPSKYSKT
jgi:hypothetical protein